MHSPDFRKAAALSPAARVFARLRPALLPLLAFLALLVAPTHAFAQSYVPLGVAATPGAGSVTLTWNPAQDAISYNVYRGTAAGGESATPIATGVTGNSTQQVSYADSTAVDGTTYYYYITAINFQGESDPSREVSATAGAALLPAPGLSTAPTPTQITLNWTSVPGATSYNLYRSTANVNFLCYLKNLTGTTFTDTQLTAGATYYYFIAPVDSDGQGSGSNHAAGATGGTVPPVPVGLHAVALNGQVVLYWNLSPGASYFNIYRSTTAGGENSSAAIATSVSTTYTDTGLTNGTTYYYKITAVSGYGESAKSNEASVAPGANPLPGPALVATPGAAQIALTWGSVSGANGYNLYRSSDNITYSSIGRNLSGTSFTDSGLSNGQTYYYIVAAINASGQGNNSNTAAATPGSASNPAPSGLFAVAGSGSVTLSWTGALQAGSYNIYRGTTSGGEGNTPIATGVANTFYTDNGLTSGTTYYYQITAVNNAAQSGRSNQASATPGAGLLPSPLLSATAGSGQAVLNWSSVPGASGYNLCRSVNGGVTFVPIQLSLNATTFTNTGLINGQNYVYYVVPLSKDGLGSASNFASATPGTAGLPAPAGVRVVNGNGQNMVYWNVLTGAASYNLYRSTTAGGEGSTPFATGLSNSYGVVSFLDSGLTNGTTYYYKVTAVSVSGEGTQSAEASGTPGAAALPAPTLTATAAGGQIVLNWSSVAGAVSYNLYRAASDSGSYSQLQQGLTGSTFTDTGLTSGRTYYYLVAAANHDGEGPQSNHVSATPGGVLLPAPAGVRVVGTGGQNTVYWNAVPGAASYNLYRGTTAGGEAPIPVATNVYNGYPDYGLTNGTTYYYKLTAVSAVGESVKSSEASGTPGATMLPAPTLTATVGSNQVVLNWSTVAGAASYNVYETINGISTSIAHGLTATTFTQAGLVGGAAYSFQVAAANVSGEGSLSSPVSVTPGGAVLPAPAGLSVAAGNGQNVLSWTPSPGATSYNIYRGTAAGGENAVPVSTSVGAGYTDTGLTNGTTYYYTVTAVSAVGESSKSSEAGGTPGATPLPAPVLTATAGSGQIVLNWSSVTGATSYNLFRSADGGGTYTAIKTGQTTTTYTDTGLNNGAAYSYSVTAVNKDGSSANSNTVNGTPNGGALPAPTGLRAVAQYPFSNLYWNPVTGATSYNLYRGTTPGGEGATPVATGITGTSFGDSPPTNGTTYYYKLTAVSAVGESVKSSEASVTPARSPLPGPPLAVAVGSGQAVLNWGAVAGADSYLVYRSTDGFNTYIVLQQGLTGTTYTNSGLTNGVTYSYIVAAVSVNGLGSNSNTVSVLPGSAVLPAPAGLRIAPQGIANVLYWNSVPGATVYNVYRGTAAGGEGAVPFAVSAGTSYPDGSLTNGTTYYYRVTALSAVGESAKSVEASGTPGATMLPAPTLTIVPGSGQVVLNWGAVAGAGSYIVSRSLDNSTFTVAAAGLTGTTYTDSGLTNGVLYYYRVVAVDADGVGSDSNTVSVIPGSIALPAPSNLRVVMAGSSLSLYWSGVPGAGSYNIYRGTTPGGEGAVPIAVNAGVFNNPDYVFSDTTASYGTTCYYKVTAVGSGAESAASNEAAGTLGSARLLGPNLTAVAGSGKIVLSWGTVPGAASYEIDRSLDGVNFGAFQMGLTGTTYTDSGLTSGETYSYAVYPVSSDGLGTSSNLVSAMPGSPTLAAPTGISTSVSGSSVFLAWNAVLGAVSYNVYRSASSNGEGSVPVYAGAPGTSYTDNGLLPHQAYYYQLTAVNSLGEGPKSGQVSAITGTTPLPAPGLTAVPGSGQVVLNWSAVSGAPSYNIYRSVDNQTYIRIKGQQAGTTYTDTGLSNGTTYFYRVGAFTDAGQGQPSNTATATPSSSGLAAPFGLQAVAQNGAVSLTWNPVPGATAYNIYRSTAAGGEGSSPLVTNVGNGFGDSGLTNAQTYYYVVTAVNGVGESAKSNEANATPGSTHLPPPLLTATAGNGQVLLTWSPLNGALSYNLVCSINGAGYVLIQSGLTSTTFTHTGLTNGTSYSYVVTGVGRFGQGDGSDPALAIPGTTGPRAPQLAATGAKGQVTLTWTNISGATSYVLYRGTTAGSESAQPYIANIVPNDQPFGTYTDTAITNGTAYYYRIAAANAVGLSSLSNEAAAAPPATGSDFLINGAPDRMTIVRGSDDVVTVSVAPLGHFSGAVTLTVSGLPTGVTAGFDPPVAGPSGSYLTLLVGAGAVPGTYPLTITGTSGSLSRQASLLLTILASVQSTISHETSPPLPKAPAGQPGSVAAVHCAPIRKTESLPAADDPNARLSLLNDIGRLAQRVDFQTLQSWRQELHQGRAAGPRAAQLHLWLGEYALAHDEQPVRARWHFRQVQTLAPVRSVAFGTARYDSAIALFYEGAYVQASDAFHSLLATRSILSGFDHKTCALLWRHAIACAGYHAERAQIGIPEPPRLDPECGVAALATALRPLNLPWDRASLRAACRVTGEGSSLTDLVAAGPKLGVAIQTVTADDQGLLLLPKPLIAYVEHDHFIAVVKADKSGVSYLCSDCGAWPGGRVNLTWSQWHALEPTHYAVVTQPGSSWNRLLTLARRQQGRSAGPLQVASSGSLSGLKSVSRLLSLLRLHRHVTVDFDSPGGTSCGAKPPAPPCTPQTDCPIDGGGPGGGDGGGAGGGAGDGSGGAGAGGGNGDSGCGGGPSAGDPVNLASGEEEYKPGADLMVYNPYGPSISWAREYRSMRSIFESAYQFNDFGVGWSQSYNVGVYDPSSGGPGTKYVYYPNGARISFSAPSVPSAATPSVQCTVQSGVALLVEWDYDANRPSGYFTITMPNRTQWVTTAYEGSVQCFLLSRVVDRNGHAIKLVYQPPVTQNGWPLLASIRDAARGTVLLSIKRTNDGTGNIAGITDVYGRSISYHVGYYPTAYCPPAYAQFYQQVDRISQVVPAHTLSPADRWAHDYSLVSNTEGQEQVPFLHTISVPSPTGTGTSTSLINYDPTTDFVSSLVDANGNTRTYTPVDQYGNASPYGAFTRVSVTNAQGQLVSSYTVGFDSNMNESSRANGSGQTVSTRVYSDPNDPFRPSSVTDGNGHTTQFTWDQFGNLLTRTSARGTVMTNTISYSPFALGELTQTQIGAKSPASFTYFEPSGLPRTIVMPKPGTVGSASTVTTSFTYDSLGNVLTRVAPGNSAASAITTTFNYTADGSYSQAAAIGQPLVVTDNLGHSSHFRYDAQGNLIKATDALGNETDRTYNLANQSVLTTLPATGQSGSGHATNLAAYLYLGGPLTSLSIYDESGVKGREIDWSYGLEGELLARTGSTDPVTYAYDGLYRIKTLSDGNGHATQYVYNRDGHLASATYPGGDSVQYPSYDPLGNPLSRIDGRGVVTNLVYNDPENLLTDLQYPASTGLNVHVGYDAYGRRASMTDGAGAIAYAYDDENLLSSVKTTYTGLAQQTIGYSYNADGSRSAMTTPGGAFSYSYDAAGRPQSLTNPFSETTSYRYTANNWPGGMTLANGVTAAYSQNARGFLTDLQNKTSGAALLSQFGSMVYDAVGNRTSVTAFVPAASALSGLTGYTYDSRDELTREQSARGSGYTNNFVYDGAGNPTTFRGTAHGFNTDNQLGDSGFSYDGAGNPTTYGNTALTFDAESRLTKVGTALTAGYMGDGLRAWKQGSAGRTYFLYDGSQPVCELNASGAVTAVNTFGAFGLVSRRAGSASVFYTFDAHGSVAQRLNSGGSVLSSTGFDAFGLALAAQPAGDPFGYGAQWGYYTDQETGLHLLGLRYYDAGQGRFLTRDPAGPAGGINQYAYVRSRAETGVDPLGLWNGSGGIGVAGAAWVYGGGADVGITAGPQGFGVYGDVYGGFATGFGASGGLSAGLSPGDLTMGVSHSGLIGGTAFTSLGPGASVEYLQSPGSSPGFAAWAGPKGGAEGGFGTAAIFGGGYGGSIVVPWPSLTPPGGFLPPGGNYHGGPTSDAPGCSRKVHGGF